MTIVSQTKMEKKMRRNKTEQMKKRPSYSKLKPEEIALNFKENKFDNVNGVTELFFRLDTRKGRCLMDCITSLTDMMLVAIEARDLNTSHRRKEAVLKNDLDKYREWMQERFNDIVKKFIQFFSHPKFAVGQCALKSLLTIIQHFAWQHNKFPEELYKRMLTSLLSPTHNNRKLIACLKEYLRYPDLVSATLKYLKQHTSQNSDSECNEQSDLHKGNKKNLSFDQHKSKEEAPDSNLQHSNLITLAMLIRMPEAEESLGELFCSQWKEGCERNEGAPREKEEGGDPDTDEEEQASTTQDALKEWMFSSREYSQESEAEAVAREARKRTADAMDVSEVNQIPLPNLKKQKVGSKERLLPDSVHDELDGREMGGEDPLDDISIADSDLEDTEESDRGPVFEIKTGVLRSALSQVWDTLITYNLTDDQYKRMLLHLPDHVLDFHTDPVSMADFFFRSFSRGGAISLLALKGVFVLMMDHNMHYPDFYPRLYSLLEPSVFSARHKARLFVLLELFLSSSHLPEYLAAAFIKRLSFLVTVAPLNCAGLVAKITGNILARFGTLRPLYDEEGENSLQEDPFCLLSSHLMEAGARDSSLWELQTVRTKAEDDLHKSCAFLTQGKPPLPQDFHAELELTHEEMETAEDPGVFMETMYPNYETNKELTSTHVRAYALFS